MKRLFWVAMVAGLAAAGVLHYLVRMERYQGFAAPVFVEIPRGTSTLGIGEKLQAAGVVRHPWLFALARLPNPRALPQAGEYLFQKPATVHEVYMRMARGDVYMIEITVPEGSNVFDIGQILEGAGLGTAREFAAVALKEEGFLFPSTYRFKRNTSAAEVARAMRRQFDLIWQEIGGGAPLRETVTLASLVEREAVVHEERERIAGVFRNRLRQGMPLQCDPTVVYAAMLEGAWRGAIYQSDLVRKHPYNTYQRAGLPPGPIANPGRASLEAALRPMETDELYFVAAPDGSGAHIFSKDHAAHEKAVGAYRRGQQKARNSGASGGGSGSGR